MTSWFKSAVIGVSCLVALCAQAGAQTTPVDGIRITDRLLGDEDAPITFIEYASVACPHCATFHQTGYQTVLEHVRSGDVRVVFREMITGEPNLAIAGFMLANCAPQERYFEVTDLLFAQLPALLEAMQTGNAQDRFMDVGRMAGFSAEDVSACLVDEAALESIQQAHARAGQDGIASTPQFLINGDRLEAVRGDDGFVYGVDGVALEDDQGLIPYTHDEDAMARVIALYLARGDD